MKLPDILRMNGDHVWAFSRNSNLTTVAAAHRRVQSAVARPPHTRTKVKVTAMILTDPKALTSEPCLLISVKLFEPTP